jgi:hypothetical protein
MGCLTWEKFDEKVVSWGRLKFGEKYARALWRDELLSLKELILDEDLDKYNFDEQCARVNDVIAHESPKYAFGMYAFRVYAFGETLCGEGGRWCGGGRTHQEAQVMAEGMGLSSVPGKEAWGVANWVGR